MRRLTDRREVVQGGAGAIAAGAAEPARDGTVRAAPLKTRGVVLLPDDLSLTDWPERASRAGLTTIALHHGNSPTVVARWIGSDAGRRFLEACLRLGLQVE